MQQSISSWWVNNGSRCKKRQKYILLCFYSMFIGLGSSFIRTLPLTLGLSLRVLITTQLVNQVLHYKPSRISWHLLLILSLDMTLVIMYVTNACQKWCYINCSFHRSASWYRRTSQRASQQYNFLQLAIHNITYSKINIPKMTMNKP